MEVNRTALLVSLLVLLSFLVFYSGYDKKTGSISMELLVKVLSFSDFEFSYEEFMKLFGLSGITLLALAFLPGPLSKINDRFSSYLHLRKPLGLIGFLFALLHGIMGLGEVEEIFEKYLELEGVGLGLGVVALLIFIAMAITSSKYWVKKLTYKRWKLLQRFGYVALLLALLHFLFVEFENGALKIRPFGYVAVFVPAIVLVLKAYVMIKGEPERRSYEEHFGK